MSCTPKCHTFKRGSTFDVAVPIVLARSDKPAPDFTGWTGRSQVRSALTGKLIAELEFVWLDPVAGICRLASPDTSKWTTGPADLDIQLTSQSGGVVHTRTMELDIEKGVTRDS